MIKILQIGLSKNRGGIESCILNYFKHINHSEFLFDFIDIYGEGLSYSKEIINLGGKIYQLSNYKKFPYKCCCELKKVLLTNEFDIIHINVLSAANILPILISALFSKKPIIVHSHNTNIPSGYFRKILHNINIHFLRKMKVEKWACGVMAGRWLWGNDFYEENIITNAIDPMKFLGDENIRKRIRTICNFSDNNVVLGFVGGLTEQKNPFFLAEIMAALKSQKKYKMLIIGDGNLRITLQKQMESMGVLDDVFFAGIQDSIELWYQAMDVFLLPSYFEGVPIVSIEAQAAGLKCIISDKITDEINFSNKVEYLTIELGGEPWAEAILKSQYNRRLEKSILPEKYIIQNAVEHLEKKYRTLCLRENR